MNRALKLVGLRGSLLRTVYEGPNRIGEVTVIPHRFVTGWVETPEGRRVEVFQLSQNKALKFVARVRSGELSGSMLRDVT
jgi:hypothetical protein